MEKKTPAKSVRIFNYSGGFKEIPDEDLLNIRTSESVERYVGDFNILVNNASGKNSELAKPDYEIEIWLGYKETGIKKVMAGYIDRIIFEKNEGSKETLQIFGRSYASVLLDRRISGRIEYTEGLSQVLRKILKSTPLKLDGILDTKGKGTVVLRNSAIIDVVRQIAEETGWTFRVDHDRIFYFCPFALPKDSGVTLTDKDIKSFRFVKES